MLIFGYLLFYGKSFLAMTKQVMFSTNSGLPSIASMMASLTDEDVQALCQHFDVDGLKSGEDESEKCVLDYMNAIMAKSVAATEPRESKESHEMFPIRGKSLFSSSQDEGVLNGFLSSLQGGENVEFNSLISSPFMDNTQFHDRKDVGDLDYSQTCSSEYVQSLASEEIDNDDYDNAPQKDSASNIDYGAGYRQSFHPKDNPPPAPRLRPQSNPTVVSATPVFLTTTTPPPSPQARSWESVFPSNSTPEQQHQQHQQPLYGHDDIPRVVWETSTQSSPAFSQHAHHQQEPTSQEQQTGFVANEFVKVPVTFDTFEREKTEAEEHDSSMQQMFKELTKNLVDRYNAHVPSSTQVNHKHAHHHCDERMFDTSSVSNRTSNNVVGVNNGGVGRGNNPENSGFAFSQRQMTAEALAQQKSLRLRTELQAMLGNSQKCALVIFSHLHQPHINPLTGETVSMSTDAYYKVVGTFSNRDDAEVAKKLLVQIIGNNAHSYTIEITDLRYDQLNIVPAPLRSLSQFSNIMNANRDSSQQQHQASFVAPVPVVQSESNFKIVDNESELRDLIQSTVGELRYMIQQHEAKLYAPPTQNSFSLRADCVEREKVRRFVDSHRARHSRSAGNTPKYYHCVLEDGGFANLNPYPAGFVNAVQSEPVRSHPSRRERSLRNDEMYGNVIPRLGNRIFSGPACYSTRRTPAFGVIYDEWNL